MPDKLKLVYLDIDDNLFTRALITCTLDPNARNAIQEKILQKLEIKRRDGETPLDAYIRSVCEANGINNKQAVLNTLESNEYTAKMITLLA